MAWGGWFFVLYTIDPQEAGVLSLVLFYLTLFMAMVGTLAVIGVVYRRQRMSQVQLMIREVKIAFRHALMLSLALITSLILSAQGLLTWWNFLALFIGVGVAEYLCLLIQESKRT